MEAATQLALRLRAAANDRLAGHEPLLLAAAPILTLLAARALHAAAGHVADRGLRTVLITLVMAALKYVSSC
jgi:sphinganine-1-phosphate aldolase